MQDFYIKLFEYGSYTSWVIIAVLLFSKWKEHRALQWILIGMTLSFPFEWLADNYWMFLNYHEDFTPMAGHFPLFMPFAWGWFFPLVIGLLLTQRKRLDAMPKWSSVLLIFGAFFLWDYLVEAWATNNGLWTYWWPEDSFLPFSELPIWIPIFTALQCPAFYYSAIWAQEKYADRSWLQGFVPFFGILLLSELIEALLGFIYIRLILGHDPTPYAPDWWVNSGWFVI